MSNFSFQPIQKFNIRHNEIQLEHHINPQIYCESTGRKSALLGFETGVFEAWVWPLKIISDLRFSVVVPQYKQTARSEACASYLINRPELTTIIYAHDLFTIKQHLLAPLSEPGIIVLFDVLCDSDLEIYVSFKPELVPMWPAGLGGQYTLWLDEMKAYYLTEGSKKFAGLIGSPLAQQFSDTPGHQLPESPMEFVLKIDPDTAERIFVPVIITGTTEGKATAIQQYQQLEKSIPDFYQQKYDYYDRIKNNYLSIVSPDASFNRSFEWAKIALDKGLVENPQLGRGLVAGYGTSGKTQRPGFGWFFGGDTFINSLAISGYGDFESVKSGLKFFQKYQRADGKIAHEITQSAALIKWFEDYPYCFYHADTTAYYIIAMHHYLQRSGDALFIEQSWDSLCKAYRFCVAADLDGDGLMENSAAGLGAMEVGKLLAQTKVDIYLAALWLRAIACMIDLCQFLKEQRLELECQQQLQRAQAAFRNLFVDAEKKLLNFNVQTDGSKISEGTVWQAVPLFFNLVVPAEVSETLDNLAGSQMSTDWGVRSLAKQSENYNPVNYNNGTVWPFSTGLVATAQYRNGRAKNGWHNLLANINMTFLSAPGWQTELLPGEFYKPVATSVPHQLFSASGIIIPVLFGLLELESAAGQRRISFSPHLPFEWNELEIRNYRCQTDSFDFYMSKTERTFQLTIDKPSSTMYRLYFKPAFAPGSLFQQVRANGKSVYFTTEETQYEIFCCVEVQLEKRTVVEIDYLPGIDFSLPLPRLVPGSTSTGLKILNFELQENIFQLKLEGISGATYFLPVQTRFLIDSVEGASYQKNGAHRGELKITFEGDQAGKYETKVVVLHLNHKKESKAKRQ